MVVREVSRILLAALILVFGSAAAWAQAPAADEARILRLQKSLLAPCCWNEAVATHRSEVSLTMRAEIARMVTEGKTDQQILDNYKQQYGLRILVEPEGSKWWWMHITPIVAIALGVLAVVWFIRRLRRPIPVPSPQ
jgi:cytochrome c-type biogenesis protein CcmH/NrfF